MVTSANAKEEKKSSEGLLNKSEYDRLPELNNSSVSTVAFSINYFFHNFILWFV